MCVTFKLIVLSFLLTLLSCETPTSFQERADHVYIPYIKNTANECYYLDDFMPMPDSMVAGRSGQMNLRYYTYKAAKYKDWKQNHIILSFYSQDERCWSLFEEYYIDN